MSTWTLLSAAAGGVLIGAAAVLLWWWNGRTAGVSGIAGGLWFGRGGDRAWRWMFLGGLALGTALWVAWSGHVPRPRPQFPALALGVAGLLVGYGTARAGGCTSGHGVCGLARLSLRSLVATSVFLASALLTTYVVRHLLHIA